MTVRRAEFEDVEYILEMAYRFNERFFDLPLNEDKTRAMIEHTIEMHVAFISRFGFIGALIVDDPVRDHVVLVETAWYAEGREGLHLLNALITEGRRLCCDEVRMTTLNTSPAAATAILSKKGFAPLETSHRLML